jgi:hypothetical protein
MKSINTSSFSKIAQEVPPTQNMSTTPISKQSLKNKIYRVITPLTQGFFHDQSWENVRKVWDALTHMGLDWNTTDSQYLGDPPSSKRWKFEIRFINNRNRPDTLYGTIIASGAGNTDDILGRYDLSVIIG